MAYRTLSYPFRLDYSNRGFGSVSSDTDTYKAEQIQAFLRTTTGERLMFPEFGIEDPVFNVFDTEIFVKNFSDYYSSDVIGVDGVQLSFSEGVVTDVIVEFR